MVERVIRYEDIPYGNGQTVYIRAETDPFLHLKLSMKGYRIISDISRADENTLFITGQRQVGDPSFQRDYQNVVDVLSSEYSINKPHTEYVNGLKLISRGYKLPFVFKNESINGGKEKFLIATEEDYDKLISMYLGINYFSFVRTEDFLYHSRDYRHYIDRHFVIQEYVNTPSVYNTSLRVLTSSSGEVMYSALKYKEPVVSNECTSLISYWLTIMDPLSTKSIVSNTLSGGSNVLIGAGRYTPLEERLLADHSIGNEEFNRVMQAASQAHVACRTELGNICGFDFIFDNVKKIWHLLEYHEKPMVGDYVRRQDISYKTKGEHLVADGLVRATSLVLELKRKK